MGVVAVVLLGILGLPFFGLHLMTDKYQSDNRLLGVAITIVGVAIWIVLFGN